LDAGVEIGEKSIHLLLGEASGEGWHLVFATEYGSNDLCVSGRGSTGKRGAAKEVAEAGRGRLQREIVFLVAVCASLLIEVLAACLLRCELRVRATAGKKQSGDEDEKDSGVHRVRSGPIEFEQA
jgi:hypothetical protein